MSQEINNIIGGLFEPYNHEKITVADTAIGMTSSVIKNNTNRARECQRVVMTAETASMRYCYDGTTPTTTVGHLMNVGDILTLTGQPAIDNFRAIRTGGTSGVLMVTFER